MPPAAAPLATRRFGMQDQRGFAALSGDCNPMHMDALAARRTQAGAPVVHGIHALLWALDAAAPHLPLDRLVQLRGQFTKFMFLDRMLSLRLAAADQSQARMVIEEDGLTLATFALRFGAISAAPAETTELEDRAENPIPAAAAPAEPDLAGMAACRGVLVAPAGADGFAAAFPAAAQALDARRIAALAQTSRLVGMVCPGLHSIYAGLTLDMIGFDAAPGLGFRAARVDERFRRVDLSVRGDGIGGTLACFARHPPVAPPTMAAIAARVAPDAFAGCHALVVGGSRGLGAIVAQLVCAGGGSAVVTYARGLSEAQSLCAAIAAHCGRPACTHAPFDALAPAVPQLAGLPGRVTDLFYLATPHIFAQKSRAFDEALHAAFLRVYATGFAELCTALPGPLRVFYPSSVAVAERPRGMTEYAMAKAAGEILCTDLDMPGLRILIDRLPRILTDQTATVTGAEGADALDTMLPLVRATTALV